jgi:hypothetical protein
MTTSSQKHHRQPSREIPQGGKPTLPWAGFTVGNIVNELKQRQGSLQSLVYPQMLCLFSEGVRIVIMFCLIDLLS